jgi:hypothetical protein
MTIPLRRLISCIMLVGYAGIVGKEDFTGKTEFKFHPQQYSI